MEQNSLEVVEVLVTGGANLDCVDFHGTSACHLACKEGKIEAVRPLCLGGFEHFFNPILGRLPKVPFKVFELSNCEIRLCTAIIIIRQEMQSGSNLTSADIIFSKPFVI